MDPVQRVRHLRGRAFVVDDDLVVSDLHRALDKDRIVVAVRVHAAAVDAVRDFSDRLAHRRFRPRLHVPPELGEVAQLALVEKLPDVSDCGVVRRHHGVEVADHLVGYARVGTDHVEERFVRARRSLDEHGRKAQALLEELARVTAEERSADVRDVRDAAHEPDQLAAPEERLDDRHVRKVSRPDPWVVREHHVALAPLARRTALEHRLRRERQGGEEGRNT